MLIIRLKMIYDVYLLRWLLVRINYFPFKYWKIPGDRTGTIGNLLTYLTVVWFLLVLGCEGEIVVMGCFCFSGPLFLFSGNLFNFDYLFLREEIISYGR